LADEIQKVGRRASAIDEAELSDWAPHAGLIINSTTKGQGGLRKLSNGMATLLESYSALAPAHPPTFAEPDTVKPDFVERWSKAARADIEANHEASLKVVERVPAPTRFYDLIYHPAETVFLRHARSTGHPTMNGKAMIVNQAMIAFCERICATALRARGLDTAETRRQILEIMYRAW
jgi:hypothetical protein